MLTTVPSALLTVPNSGKLAKWMMYSACTSHMTNNRNYFVNFTACEGVVQVGNSETISSYGYADIKVVATVGGTRYRITLQRVLFTPT